MESCSRSAFQVIGLSMMRKVALGLQENRLTPNKRARILRELLFIFFQFGLGANSRLN